MAYLAEGFGQYLRAGAQLIDNIQVYAKEKIEYASTKISSALGISEVSTSVETKTTASTNLTGLYDHVHTQNSSKGAPDMIKVQTEIVAKTESKLEVGVKGYKVSVKSSVGTNGNIDGKAEVSKKVRGVEASVGLGVGMGKKGVKGSIEAGAGIGNMKASAKIEHETNGKKSKTSIEVSGQIKSGNVKSTTSFGVSF